MEPGTLLRITVDPEVCTGVRLCTLAASHVFSFDEAAGVSVPPDGTVVADEEALDAIEGCPTEAIIAHHAETGERVFP